MTDLKSIIRGESREWTDEDSADVDLAHEPARKLGARCDECPLYGHREGPVLGEIRPGKALLLVGEAPGKQEIERARPFVGPSGKEVDKALSEAGLGRQDVSITNVLLCRPPKGKSLQAFLTAQRRRNKGALDPLEACAPRLRREIELAAPQGILTLGSAGLARIAKTYRIHLGERKKRGAGERALLGLEKQRGHPFILPRLTGEPGGPVLIATYHPAHALRSARWELGAIRRDVAKIKRIVVDQQGTLRFRPADRILAWCPPLPSSPWKVEIPHWFHPEHDPDVFESKVREALEALDRNPKAVLTVDIETAGTEPTAKIRIVNLHWYDGGLTRTGAEWVVIIPLHYRSGSRIEPKPGFHDRMQEILRAFLKPGRKLAFQNGTFDTGHLLRERYLTDRSRTWLDTMPAHRASEWAEARHNLGAILADQAGAVGDMQLHKDQHLHGGADKEG